MDSSVTSSRCTLSRSRVSTASPPSARPRASFNCCSRPRMRLRNSSFSSWVSRSVVSTVARRCPSTMASVSDAILACGQLGESAQTLGLKWLLPGKGVTQEPTKSSQELGMEGCPDNLTLHRCSHPARICYSPHTRASRAPHYIPSIG